MASKGITVVVPCYNAEPYLRRCLESLRNQSFSGVQVLMIEDFSTDNTKSIVKEYERKYKNFKAIYNKDNRGAGYCRNIGKRKTKTEFITFLDADDWLPTNFLEVLHDAIIKSGADISICDMYLRYDDPSEDTRVDSYSIKLGVYDFIDTGLAASSNNKLFKAVLLDSLEYPEDIMNEDVPVVLTLLYKNKAVYAGETYYNYYQRGGSTQNSFQITKKRLDAFQAIKLLKENIREEVDAKAWQAIVWHQIIVILLFIFPKAKGVIYRGGLIKEFHQLMHACNIDLANNDGFVNFMNQNKINKAYGSGVNRLINAKKYTAASILLGIYGWYTRSKYIGKALFVFRHPFRFARQKLSRIRKFIFRKYVIKKNIDMQDIRAAAQAQSALPGEGRVSVIIPNYNYQKYLLQRLYSILYQTEKLGEIIILDDKSTDDSVALAREIKNEIDKLVSVRLINNKENKGTFRQWERGFSESIYEYVWIAEADDYSEKNFLKVALEPLRRNKQVVLSYVDTGYVTEGGRFIGSVKPDIDYQASGHWDQDYINGGPEEVMTYSSVNNTIANVSSVIFRKRADINYKKIFEETRRYKQAGDWVFYVNYMFYGSIAYTNSILNYYRLHGANVSSVTKAQDHLKEIEQIYEYIGGKIQLKEDRLLKQQERIRMLRKVWHI